MSVEDILSSILLVLLFMLCFKDMSGKEELRKIREQLETIAKSKEV